MSEGFALLKKHVYILIKLYALVKCRKFACVKLKPKEYEYKININDRAINY